MKTPGPLPGTITARKAASEKSKEHTVVLPSLFCGLPAIPSTSDLRALVLSSTAAGGTQHWGAGCLSNLSGPFQPRPSYTTLSPSLPLSPPLLTATCPLTSPRCHHLP